MSLEDILCIIPARAGSKGVPGKNTRMLGGIPLFAHSVKHALSANIPAGNVVVTSDDDDLLRYANHWFSVLTHKRPKEISGDNSSTEEALLDVVNTYPRKKTVLLLQPTSPFRFNNLVSKCIESYEKEDYDSLLTTTKFYNFLWQKVSMGNDRGYSENTWQSTYNYRSRPMRQSFSEQDYIHFENGCLYMTDTNTLTRTKCRIGAKPCIYPISMIESFQIDTMEDFEIARLLFSGELCTKNAP